MPAGVHVIHITAFGGGASAGSGFTGGSGGSVTTTWYVNPGDQLPYSVGGGGAGNFGTIGNNGGTTTMSEQALGQALTAPGGGTNSCCGPGSGNGGNGGAGTVTTTSDGTAFNTDGQAGNYNEAGKNIPGAGTNGGTAHAHDGLIVITLL